MHSGHLAGGGATYGRAESLDADFGASNGYADAGGNNGYADAGSSNGYADAGSSNAGAGVYGGGARGGATYGRPAYDSVSGYDGYDDYGPSGGYDGDYQGGGYADGGYASDGWDGPDQVTGDPDYKARRHRPSANDTNVGTLADFAAYGGGGPERSYRGGDERYVQNYDPNGHGRW